MKLFIALIALVVSSASYAACVQKHQELSGLDSAAGRNVSTSFEPAF